MHTDTGRALVITIKSDAGLSEAEARQIAEQVRLIAGADRYAVGVQEIVGAGCEMYISTRPNKADRLGALARLPKGMTTRQIADSLGWSERQVYRYRAMLKAVGAPEDAAADSFPVELSGA